MPADVEVIAVPHGAESENEETGLDGSEDDASAASETEEWGGVATGANLEGKKNNRPPTAQELREIKDASDIFQSSSFKLQVRKLNAIDSFCLIYYTD